MIRNKRKMGNNRSIKEGMTGLKPPGKALSVIGAIRRQHFIAGALAVLVLLIMGCASPLDEPLPERDIEQSVNVTLGPGFVFNPDTFSVDPGRPVELVVENMNDVNHTFTIDELNIDLRVLPGQQQEITFTPAETGTYEFYCAEPGHREQGMVGLLGVGEEPDPLNGPAVTDEEEDDGATGY